MKQLHELTEKVAKVITQNTELKGQIDCLMQESDLLAEKAISLAQENALLQEKIAALTQENAAILLKFDEVQTQAIQGLDAIAERDQLSSSINELLASIDTISNQRDSA